MDRCATLVLGAHQIGRGGDLGPVLGLHFNFEICRLVRIDLGDFGLGLVRRLAGGFYGSAQRIENAGVAGEGFELPDAGAGLVRHEVVKVEANLFDRLGDLGIAGSIALDFAFDGSRQFRGRSGFVDRKGMFPLGGEVRLRIGGKAGGRVGIKIVRVPGRVHGHSCTANSGGAAAPISGSGAEGRCHRPGCRRSGSGSRSGASAGGAAADEAMAGAAIFDGGAGDEAADKETAASAFRS